MFMSAVTYQKDFIFRIYVPGRVFESIDTVPRVYALVRAEIKIKDTFVKCSYEFILCKQHLNTVSHRSDQPIDQ